MPSFSDARKKYGNFTPVVGDIVLRWGTKDEVYKVVDMMFPGSPGIVGTYGEQCIHIGLCDLRPATPVEAAKYPRIKARHDKEIGDRLTAEKAKRQMEDAELTALKEFCESSPLTSLNGEMWKQVRALSSGAGARFANSGYNIPTRE